MVLQPARLPTPPAVALQVAATATRPECRAAEIVALLSQDPALCAKVLRAANSCLYGLRKPVTSLDRAVTVLGLNPLRSLVLGLTLTSVRTPEEPEGGLREYWLGSVSGAIMARELAARRHHPVPETDMVATLLRDLGAVLLERAYPDGWGPLAAKRGAALPAEVCELEREAFGIDHADVTAELLARWGLAPELTEPIRRHHDLSPAVPLPPEQAARAELLFFVEHLVRADAIARHPDGAGPLLSMARAWYGLTQPALLAFLESVQPKVAALAELLDLDVGRSPDYSRVLAAGEETFVGLATEAGRNGMGRAGGGEPA